MNAHRSTRVPTVCTPTRLSMSDHIRFSHSVCAWLWAALLLCAMIGDAVTVAGCGECTLYAEKVWCPSTMTCHPQANCTCAEPCRDFRDCFFAEPTCRGCVSSLGVFCHRPNTKPSAVGAPTNPCFFPADYFASSRTEVIAAMAAAPTCEAQCTGEGARCVSALADCPSEPVDKVAVLAATTAVAVSAVLAVVSVAWVLRRVLSPQGRAAAPPASRKNA